MSFKVTPGAENIPLVKAILAKQIWCDRLTDGKMGALGAGYWTPEEWKELEAVAKYNKQKQQNSSRSVLTSTTSSRAISNSSTATPYYLQVYYPQQHRHQTQ